MKSQQPRWQKKKNGQTIKVQCSQSSTFGGAFWNVNGLTSKLKPISAELLKYKLDFFDIVETWTEGSYSTEFNSFLFDQYILIESPAHTKIKDMVEPLVGYS